MSVRILKPTGDKNSYKAFSRELFYDILRKNQTTQELEEVKRNIFIWYRDKWHLIGGENKQKTVETGPNIFIEDALVNNCDTLVLDNNILINSMKLGKNQNCPQWKGTTLLGKTQKTSFFPLTFVTDTFSSDVIGGQFQIHLKYKEEKEERIATCHASISGSGNAKITSNFRNLSIHQAKVWNGETYDLLNGLKFATSEKRRIGKKFVTVNNLIPQYITVYFNGWKVLKKDPPLTLKESDIVESVIIS